MSPWSSGPDGDLKEMRRLAARGRVDQVHKDATHHLKQPHRTNTRDLMGLENDLSLYKHQDDVWIRFFNGFGSGGKIVGGNHRFFRKLVFGCLWVILYVVSLPLVLGLGQIWLQNLRPPASLVKFDPLTLKA